MTKSIISHLFGILAKERKYNVNKRAPLLNGRMMIVKVLQPVIVYMNLDWLGGEHTRFVMQLKCYFKRRTWEVQLKNPALNPTRIELFL
jgi:hypothetical protein